MDNRDHTDVIIIGGSHHNTLGVIRAIAYKVPKDYIHLVLHGDQHTFITKTKYLNRTNIHYISDCEQISATIIDIVKNIKTKPALICCGDIYIATIDRDFDKLNGISVLPNAQHTASRINYFLSKDKQSEVATAVGLKEPPHLLVETKDLMTSSILPCFIKPVNSIEGGKLDIEICRTADDLSKYIQTHPNILRVRVEELINKQVEFQLIGCSLENDIIIPGYTHILRQPPRTNTGYLKYNPINDGFISEDLLNKVVNLIHNIGYHGLFSVEFIRDQGGNDYFLEINMRNDGNAFCVTCAGVNLPYIWYKYAGKTDYCLKEALNFERSAYWMPEADIRNIKNVGPLKWLKQWITADGHGIANFKDPMPLLYFIFSKSKSRLFK